MVDTTTNTTITIDLWDDPESKLHFLQTSLKDEEWSATIMANEGDQAVVQQRLSDIRESLDYKGYKLVESRDQNGYATLIVTSFGDRSSTLSVTRQVGLIQGFGQLGRRIQYQISELGDFISATSRSVKGLVDYVIGNKAKLIGTNYLAGDIAIITNGKSDGSGEKITADKKLASTYGVFGAIQSAIFMLFATEGIDQFRNQFAHKLKADRFDSLDALSESLEKGDTRKGFLKYMERNAVKVGSVFQIIGRGFWAAAGWASIARGKKGLESGTLDSKAAEALINSGKSKFKDSALSVSAWAMIAGKEKRYDTYSSNPFTRLYQKFRANKNVVAGVLNSGSTLFGIKSGIDQTQLVSRLKNGEVTAKEGLKESIGNADFVGNMMYLAGDATVAIMRTDDYDEAEMRNPRKLAVVAVDFLEKLPIALGYEAKEVAVHDIAKYLVSRLEDQKDQPAMTDEGRYDLTMRVQAAIWERAPQHHLNLAAPISVAATIVAYFPRNQRAGVRDALVSQILANPSVTASKDEMNRAIDRAVLANPVLPSENNFSMRHLQQEISALAEAMPGEVNSQRLLRLYDTVRPYVRALDNPQITPQPLPGSRASREMDRREANAATPSYGITI